MKKINWRQVREIIEYICFANFCCLGGVSLLLFIIAYYDNNEIIRNIAFGGAVITFISMMVAWLTLIIDFVCECKKYRYEEAVMIIEEGIVV